MSYEMLPFCLNFFFQQNTTIHTANKTEFVQSPYSFHSSIFFSGEEVRAVSQNFLKAKTKTIMH